MSKTPMAFDGSIPENYDKYLGPFLFTFSSEDTAARVEELGLTSGSLLEIAAGTGITTEHIHGALPKEVAITATDISPAMINYAQEKRGNLANITWQQADALELPFEDETFDAVVCQFGIMFFPDKDKGLREMFRVLKPGGTVIVNVWDSAEANPVVKFGADTIVQFFDEGTPRFMDVPFGFNDVPKITSMFKEAGFSAVESHTVVGNVSHVAAEDMARGMVTGNPTVTILKEQGKHDPESVIDALSSAIAEKFGSETPSVTLQEIAFVATK